ncbi:MAG TPA: TRAP transporter substrate-binding protein [Paracoccus sp. (in: a-proteobacteria)]|uniref:TRAP transporter substrate-binding protein n=1 Tax=Paracoccus sp. TaxID=267 RepID=UPI002CDCAAF0|nr:TRAP transporter substrate-binding protein [Paracoccus sp. (in: a-proteobacteria)]HWL55457.1 TRAP transporter substrate-binding protein [Paracoccus sp. (in: a-proteobacteria)]
MHRHFTARAVASLCLAAAAAGFSLPAHAADLTIRMAHPFAPGGPEDRANAKFAEILKEKSGGKVTAEIYPGGQLGGMQQIIQGIPTGLANGIFISSGTLGLIDPVVSMTVWPYLFKAKANFDCAYAQPEGLAYLEHVRETTGFLALAPAYKGTRHLYSTRPVTDIADLKGLKVRVAPIPVYSKPWEALGAVPTGIDVAEAYTALRQGVVDAVEIELPTARALRFHEVARHVVLTGHAMDNYAWLFDEKWLTSQDPDTRRVIEAAATEASAWFSDQSVKEEEAVLALFKESGATIHTVDRDVLHNAIEEPMRKALPDMVPWVDRFRAAGDRCG